MLAGVSTIGEVEAGRPWELIRRPFSLWVILRPREAEGTGHNPILRTLGNRPDPLKQLLDPTIIVHIQLTDCWEVEAKLKANGAGPSLTPVTSYPQDSLCCALVRGWAANWLSRTLRK